MGEGRAEIFRGDRKLVSGRRRRRRRGNSEGDAASEAVREARGCSSVDGTLG